MFCREFRTRQFAQYCQRKAARIPVLCGSVSAMVDIERLGIPSLPALLDSSNLYNRHDVSLPPLTRQACFACGVVLCSHRCRGFLHELAKGFQPGCVEGTVHPILSTLSSAEC